MVESGDYEAYSAHFEPNDVIKEEYEVLMVQWGSKDGGYKDGSYEYYSKTDLVGVTKEPRGLYL